MKVEPGYRASDAVLDSCGASEQELTGDLAADLVGAWRQGTGGANPLTALASSPQVIIFEPDGTGQIWWVHTEEALADGGHVTFEWRVEGAYLIVNDLPPAEVASNGPGSVLVREPGGEPPDAAAWTNCGDTPEVPEVRRTPAVMAL